MSKSAPAMWLIHIPQKRMQQSKDEILISGFWGRDVSAPSPLLKKSHDNKENMKQKHKLSSSKKPGDTCDPEPQHTSLESRWRGGK